MASATADSSSIEANAAPPAAAAAARGKRPVWNVPSNGAIEVGPVMGAVSWPALSESTKASPKSSSSDSLKSLSDGLGSASAPPGPSVSSPSWKPSNSAPNPSPIQNPVPPVRQKSVKRGGGSGGGSGSGSSSSSTPTNGGVGPALQPLASSGTAGAAPDKQTVPEPSPKVSKSGGLTPQAHGGGDQHRGYGGNRRGNNSGGSHHSHGNRRDQEWNHHRNAHMQHPLQRGGAGSIRSYPRPPPPVSPPFLGPPAPVRPFLPHAIGLPEVPPHLYLFTQAPAEPLGGMPFVPHPLPHAMFLPSMDPQRALLLKQIEYYFSSENLCRDLYLRQNMDDQGFVPVSLIAGFNRVKLLTNNIQYILDTVRLSSVVEVQGERIRRHNDWRNWLLLPSNHIGFTSTPRSSDYDAVTTRFQNVSLEGANTNHNGMRGPIHGDLVLTRSASGNLNNQFQVVEDPNRGGSGQVTGFTDLDRSRSSLRSLSRSDTL